MRVAVAWQDGQIHGHFGHCDCFAIYDYSDCAAGCRKKLVETGERQGHAAMAELMRQEGVDAVICGDMGSEARALLLSMGIVPVPGYAGDADVAADLLVTGRLPVDAAEGCGGGCACGGACGSEEDGCACGGGCACSCGE